MGKKRIVAASVSALVFIGLGSGSAFAATGMQAQATATTAKEDKSRRVCRNLTLTGSRMTTRFCRSQEEWDRDAEKAQRDQLDSRLNHSSRDGAQNKN